MTVGELIEELRRFPLDMEVGAGHSSITCYAEGIESVLVATNDRPAPSDLLEPDETIVFINIGDSCLTCNEMDVRPQS